MSNLQGARIRRELLASVCVLAVALCAGSKSAVAQSSAANGTETVIVTAEKRSEDAQTVPVPVTAISADDLLKNNDARVQDYFSQIPGLSYAPGFVGQPFLVIRGVTTGASSTANPTVGVMIDDVPYGSSTGLGGGGFGAPDIDPGDLQRVEVLRGPQGTLYGASSMGGLIKYVTVDPSTDGIFGQLQAGVSSVTNGAEPGYNVRGSINVPLSNDLAIRASAFRREDPGYIDNPSLGLNGVNETIVNGGRLSLLYRPTDNFTFKVSGLMQDSQTNGLPYVLPTLGDLEQNFSQGGLVTKIHTDAFSATGSLDLGSVQLTSITGYSYNKNYSVIDYTPFLSPALNLGQFGVPGTLTKFVSTLSTKKVSEELRAATTIGSNIDILVGGFFTNEGSPKTQSAYVVNPAANGAIVGDWVDFILPSTFTEYAIFGDITYHFSDKFDVQLGGRESFGDLTAAATYQGPYVPAFLHKPSPFVNPTSKTKANPFTYLFTPRYKISDDLMIYARLASGYRPGGPNTSALALGVPANFKPDQTYNYEIGSKGSLFDNFVTFDASLYYIDWKNIQIFLREPTTRLVYYANGGGAKSEGAELSVQLHPTSSLTIGTWGAWDDAQLTDALPATSSTSGAAGSPLPFAPHFSGNLSATQNFELTDQVLAYVGASLNYVGDRKGVFTATAARQDLPSYAQVNLNAGIQFDNWTANFYVNNIGDERGVISGGLGDTYPTYFNYIQPRTIGMSLGMKFQ